jgi:PadR family transcriptional regulator AphA
MSSLTPTARVILGMLKLGVLTGYDIKKAIDASTRFFWGASFGQIYPELRKLREAGLVEGRDVPRGQVKRTVYSLTPAGEQALHDWLTDTESFTFELREEGLLRLFFGDALSREEVVANLRAQQGFLELVLDRLREIEAEAPGFASEDHLHPYLALQYGLGLITWMRDWYAKTEQHLASGRPLLELDHDEPSSRESRLGPTG